MREKKCRVKIKINIWQMISLIICRCHFPFVGKDINYPWRAWTIAFFGRLITRELPPIICDLWHGSSRRWKSFHYYVHVGISYCFPYPNKTCYISQLSTSNIDADHPLNICRCKKYRSFAIDLHRHIMDSGVFEYPEMACRSFFRLRTLYDCHGSFCDCPF